MNDKNSDRGALIAAAIFMATFFAAMYIMPTIMKKLAETSEWLAYTVGALITLSFFGVLWLRARYQRKRDGEG